MKLGKISLNIYTRLEVCYWLSSTFRSGDLPSPPMDIFFQNSHLD